MPRGVINFVYSSFHFFLLSFLPNFSFPLFLSSSLSSISLSLSHSLTHSLSHSLTHSLTLSLSLSLSLSLTSSPLLPFLPSSLPSLFFLLLRQAWGQADLSQWYLPGLSGSHARCPGTQGHRETRVTGESTSTMTTSDCL